MTLLRERVVGQPVEASTMSRLLQDVFQKGRRRQILHIAQTRPVELRVGAGRGAPVNWPTTVARCCAAASASGGHHIFSAFDQLWFLRVVTVQVQSFCVTSFQQRPHTKFDPRKYCHVLLNPHIHKEEIKPILQQAFWAELIIDFPKMWAHSAVREPHSKIQQL